jgi:hypothetical protein
VPKLKMQWVLPLFFQLVIMPLCKQVTSERPQRIQTQFVQTYFKLIADTQMQVYNMQRLATWLFFV